MSPSARRIAVLGAPDTEAATLATQLSDALGPDTALDISAPGHPNPGYDLALLLGLDLPPTDSGKRATLLRLDTQLRQQLDILKLPYRMVYGHTGSERLGSALLALGLSAADGTLGQARQQVQYQLNRGRTPWLCEKCSDPDCEHRLFTQLLKGPGSPSPAARDPRAD